MHYINYFEDELEKIANLSRMKSMAKSVRGINPAKNVAKSPNLKESLGKMPSMRERTLPKMPLDPPQPGIQTLKRNAYNLRKSVGPKLKDLLK